MFRLLTNLLLCLDQAFCCKSGDRFNRLIVFHRRSSHRGEAANVLDTLQDGDGLRELDVLGELDNDVPQIVADRRELREALALLKLYTAR